MSKPRSPQEKKLLSYEKDRRNAYGERGSHSRHAIAGQKACNRRAVRHRADQVLKNIPVTQVDLLDEADVLVKTIPRRLWGKYPDQPLGKVVKRKLERRVGQRMNEIVKETLKDKSPSVTTGDTGE
jgi:hypothetical protein